MAAGEVPLRPRRDAGLGGASWEAMMRPSCCRDNRPSSPSSTTTTAPALLTGQQLQGVSVILHGVVPRHSPAVLETQDMPACYAVVRAGCLCRLVDRVGPSIGKAMTTQRRVPRILCSLEELPTESLDSLSRPPADSPGTTRRSSCAATMFHLIAQAENGL